MKSVKQLPASFDGYCFVSNNPNWKHYGEMLVVGNRNVIDPSYYDCIALDGSSPAVSVGQLKEMFLAGKLKLLRTQHRRKLTCTLLSSVPSVKLL